VALVLGRGGAEVEVRHSDASDASDVKLEVTARLPLKAPEVRRLRQWCVTTPGVHIEWKPRDGPEGPGADAPLAFDIVISQGVTAPGCLRPFLLGLRQLESIRKLELELEDTNRGILALYGETLAQRLEAGEASRRLADLNQRKDEFLAMLAHELRNPLAAIRAATSELRRGEDDPDPEVLTVLDRQLLLLARLVDDLLDVSRMTRGRLELTSAPVDLRDAVRDAVRTVQHAAAAKQIRLESQLESRPAVVDGDADRLMQIAVNLLDNAIKYTPEGGVVQARVHAEDDAVRLVVADSGRGFNPAEGRRLFDLFVQQVHRDDTPHGLGLGLTLVRSLVQLHGGDVSAHSPGEGQGSSFVATFPRGATADLEPETEAPSSDSGAGTDGRALSVLLVEDNDDLRLLFGAGLRRYFDHVDEASSGLEALEALEQRHDVVILDLGLPGLDGYEVARRARAAGSKARLVAITGHGSEADRSRTREAGFDHHLVKPVAPEAVIELVKGKSNHE
jgi:signal transduction histidine kinase